MDESVLTMDTAQQPKEDKASRRFRTRLLARYAWQNKGVLLLGFVLTGIAVLADLAGPYVVGQLVDHELIEGVGARNMQVFFQMLAVFFVAVLVASAMRYAGNVVFNHAANRVAQQMQQDVFSHVQLLPIAFFDNLPAGKVVSRITNDTKAVKVLYQVVLAQLTTALIYGAGIYLGLLAIDFRLTLIALIPLPIMIVVLLDFKRKSARYNRAYRRALSDLNGNLNENIQGMEVIQAFGQEERIYEEFSKVNDEVYTQGVKITRLFAYSAFNATQTLEYLVLVIVLLYFGYGELSGAWLVPIGNLYIFVDYMIKFFGQMQNAMHRIGDLERASGAADHIFELLQLPQVEEEGRPVEILEGVVDFEDVTFAYKEEKVLRHVSFCVEPGETAAFVGQTGSGKSTVLNLLLGFYQPQQGVIRLDGQPLAELDRQMARRQMAVVLQDPYLFTGTILSNITLNDPSIPDTAAHQAMLDVGGEAFLGRLPEGLRTPVRERGQGFSAGERQLISFARALVRNPRLLVLDEATANVDSETETAIQEGVRRLEEGRTTLIIAHRLSTIKHADKIFVLDRGRIVEAGNHDELIEQGGLYRDMYEAQSSENGHI